MKEQYIIEFSNDSHTQVASFKTKEWAEDYYNRLCKSGNYNRVVMKQVDEKIISEFEDHEAIFEIALEHAEGFSTCTEDCLVFEIDDSSGAYQVVRNLARTCGAVGWRLIKMDTYKVWQVPEDFQGEAGKYLLIEE